MKTAALKCILTTALFMFAVNPLLFSQEKWNYDTAWAEVQKLESLGQVRSAIEKAAQIYAKADAEKREVQKIRALEYRIRLNSQFEEEYFQKGIAEIYRELPSFSSPAKQLVHALLADLYMGYYTANRYRILSRTNLSGEAPDDIGTWGQRHFLEKIFEEYGKALQNPGLLQSAKTRDYVEVLKDGDSLNTFRPALYDILAHHALDFYMNDEFMAGRPAVRFEIDNPQMMDIAESFVKMEFEEKEPLSLKYHALILFRDLIEFHLKDEDPAALVNLDLKRLEFVHEHATFSDKDKVYLHTLEQMESLLIGKEPVTEVYFRIAKQYVQSATQFKPLESDDHRHDLTIAAQYCKNALNEFPDSYGASHCKYLLSQIMQKSLRSTMQYANLPGGDMLASVSFKNVANLYIRIIPLDAFEERNTNRNQRAEEKMERYRNTRPIKQWSVELPVEPDHHQHITELAIPPLPEGFYGLLISDDAAFEADRHVRCFNSFWVTGIAYMNKYADDGKLLFYVVNRKTGEHLAGVNAILYEDEYDHAVRESRMIESGRYTSDEKGAFVIPARKEKSRRLVIEFVKEGDRFLSPGTFHSSAPYNSPEKTIRKTHFFTDRSIYRPGQTIYFKGIVMEQKGKEYQILKNESTTVDFLDANYQKIASLELLTNEYGSVKGSFQAPVGKLTGSMQIRNESGGVSILVEEYKRPQFEIIFDPVKGSYKLKSEISLSGKAMAYSGQPVDHASVKYRIVRNAYFPYIPYGKRYYPQTEQAEIGSGETETDGSGSFTINFRAVPGQSDITKYTPVFTYTVYVDVTDISGETHSGQKSVSVSEKALLLDIEIPELLNAEKENTFKVMATNLNGEEEPVKVSVNIMKLQAPERIYKDREWELPDVLLLSESDFRQKFPNFAYKDENDPDTWKSSEIRHQSVINTGEKKELVLDQLAQWPRGQYKAVLSATDRFGGEVKITKYFKVYSPSAGSPPTPAANWFVLTENTAKPGDTVELLIGTSFKDAHIHFEVSNKNGPITHEWLNLSNQQRRIKIPVREEDREGIGISMGFVFNNENYSNTAVINVPYTNKKLDLAFESFRNKLSPGQEEKWNIRIRAENGDRVAAEMLAGMYDASLDAFRPHNWSLNLYNYRYHPKFWNTDHAFVTVAGWVLTPGQQLTYPKSRTYKALIWSGVYSRGWLYYKGNRDMRQSRAGMALEADASVVYATTSEDEMIQLKEQNGDGELPPATEQNDKDDHIPIRRNLQETAFFFPDLRTNENGEVVISFTIPEALTRWKMMGLAHTQDLSTGQITKELLTQKELMIIPNHARFFREGDKIWFSARVVNLSEKELKGEARLQLFDAISMQPVDESYGNDQPTTAFTASKGNTSLVSWKLNIPLNAGPLICRVTVSSGNFSDGEEVMVPVLTNRMLVTESMPLPVKGNESKKFVFNKLADLQNVSNTLSHYSYTLEFTSNPAWYAVQALPSLMEYPHECSEQVFNRIYANGLASHIIKQQPKIKTIFESWKQDTPDALLSKLEKNQDLKNALLEESPWVLQAKNETERKQRIALLFDFNNMDNSMQAALNTLQQKQLPSGGWPWFEGGRDNRFVTQYIIAGFGKMLKIGVLNQTNKDIATILTKGIKYMDDRMLEDYKRIKESHDDYLNNKYISHTIIQYLYARSFFLKDYAIAAKYDEGFGYFSEQAQKYWLDQDKYLQGMIALMMHRLDKTEPANLIMRSIREHALYDDEMGMYWRRDAGYYWHEAPIETQALLIEAFEEILRDNESVELMKTWLLKNKQTNDWETTRATADACYALLMRGENLIAEEGKVRIQVGSEEIKPYDPDALKPEAGTGYFRRQWPGNEISEDMAVIRITKSNEGIAWGAVYWQYFEDLDKITKHASPLHIKKSLFLKINTPEGPLLEAVKEGDVLETGDKLVSRIEIRVDRDMEFVHLKDMRAAALEPENQLSGYRWQGGLGYYESIRDASVNFFFAYLQKGTWVFEYTLNVTQKGNFSNGITTIQCMYAPEFASHSEGVRITVK